MTESIIVVLSISILIVFCVRHFFIQLVALKLFLDVLGLLLIVMRSADQNSTAPQAASWLILSTGTLVFFILMAGGIRHFATSSSLDTKASHE